MYGSELFTLTSSLLAKLERCQQWFLKNIFDVPKFALIRLILKLSSLNSIESEIALRKLLFLGRIITENKLTPTVRNLFRYRVDSYFDENICSLGILPSICEALHRYEVFDYFESWFHNSTFPNYWSWKTIVKSKINKSEENAWNEYALSHPNLDIARACLENVPPRMFWAITDIYPDLVSRRHVQVRLMSNFGLNSGIPWLAETDGSLCFTFREDNETLCHFFFDCPTFKPNFDSLWCNLILKASNLNTADGTQISQFITDLDRFHKALLLLGCLRLPFDDTTVTSINKFIASAVAKIYKIRKEKLRELEAPWLLK